MVDKSKLYGITHDMDGSPKTQLVRMLKVGIGYTKGPAIHVYIDAKGKWVVEVGVKDAKRTRFNDRAEAKEFYTEQRRHAPNRQYPGKFPYFTFDRIGIDGQYYPDWDAVAHHGPIPNEIEIVCMSNSPLAQSMQWWTAAELKCEGNGRDAERRVNLAETEEEKRLAAKAEAAGRKFFPITEGCYATGCPHARGDKAVCKPHTRLNFQLAYSPMIGGTCTYDTTGFRSGTNLFSCLEQIRSITGRENPDEGVVAGIKLLLTLRPYRTSHKGKPSTQYGVSLQMRAEDVVALYRKVISEGDEFKAVAQSPRQIAAPEPESIEATRMEAEFYPEEESESTGWETQGDAGIDMPQRRSEAAERDDATQPTPTPPTETPAEVPPAVAKMWATMTDMKSSIGVLLQGKAKLKQLLPEHGESEYYRVLKFHGAEHANEFQEIATMKRVARDLLSIVETAKAMAKPEHREEPYRATDSDLPEILRGEVEP